MRKSKVGQKKDIVLAVGVVRNLERVLIRASRKRTLTPEYRRKLLKEAAYLRRKRMTACERRVELPALCWVKILRFLAQLIATRTIREVFGKWMGE